MCIIDIMFSMGFLGTLEQSVKDGTVSEEAINTACRRVLEAKYKLGLFADPYKYCDTKRPKKDIFTADNRAAARRIAAETFVLLKNQDNLLPLKREGKIALIGPLADTRANMAGTWCVAYTPDKYSTLKEGFERALKGKAELLYAQGCNLMADAERQRAAEFGKTINRGDDAALKAEALAVAAKADVIICAMGESAEMSGECASRSDLRLPDVQRELLAELVKLGKPVVMLNFSGRPTVLTWEQDNVDAILNVWFGGSEAADAICDVVFGDVAPSGRLTMTFPRTTGQSPMYYNHLNTGRPVPEGTKEFRKYASNWLDVVNDPLYPFGYGLSYTTFSYGKPSVTGSGRSFKATVAVTNTGSKDACEVVQLYMHDPVASIARPVKELKGFRRIMLKAGETKEVTFDITEKDLSYYDAEGRQVFEPGKFDIMLGHDSRSLQTVSITAE
ncbi:MAG: glycoside hydrolase family 3 C-terminal domain-containing protein, partial [Clostridiales bacterium]|nr:glycoside hydrolase family 3 C-terminal domain-containing protein [Clostridiales bacterium]